MFQLDDLKKLDPTKIDLTRLDVRKLDLPKFDLPKFDRPQVDLPVDVPVERLVGLARDAAYVGIGAAVVTARAADERRRTLTDQVANRVRKLVHDVA